MILLAAAYIEKQARRALCNLPGSAGRCQVANHFNLFIPGRPAREITTLPRSTVFMEPKINIRPSKT
jgi:hypothetical protein